MFPVDGRRISADSLLNLSVRPFVGATIQSRTHGSTQNVVYVYRFTSVDLLTFRLVGHEVDGPFQADRSLIGYQLLAPSC